MEQFGVPLVEFVYELRLRLRRVDRMRPAISPEIGFVDPAVSNGTNGRSGKLSQKRVAAECTPHFFATSSLCAERILSNALVFLETDDPSSVIFLSISVHLGQIERFGVPLLRIG